MTRSFVDDDLSSISGTLPMALAATFDGLKISEIDLILDKVLKDSLHLMSDNAKLNNWQVNM